MMKIQNAGGTSGGLGSFLWGFVMAVAGGYLLMQQVTVSSGGWYLFGYNSFGLSLVPFLAGVGLLFANGKSVSGWLLLVASLVIIVAGVLMNLNLYFRSTSLFNMLMMLVLLAGGIGLIARSVRPR